MKRTITVIVIVSCIVTYMNWNTSTNTTPTSPSQTPAPITLTPVTMIPDFFTPTPNIFKPVPVTGPDVETIVANLDFMQLQQRVEIYVTTDTGGNIAVQALSNPPPNQTVGNVTITYKAWKGQWHEVYWVDMYYCNTFTRDYMIALFVKKFNEARVPLEFGMPLIESESGFEQYVVEGGKCRLKQNNHGAPAYGAGQIFKPAHPNLDYIRLATDPEYATTISINIYIGMFRKSGGTDWIEAAAWYKGFSKSGGKNAAVFIANYMPAYNRGTYKGQ